MQASVGVCNATGTNGDSMELKHLYIQASQPLCYASQKPEGPAASRRRTVTASASAAGMCSRGAARSAVLTCLQLDSTCTPGTSCMNLVPAQPQTHSSHHTRLAL